MFLRKSCHYDNLISSENNFKSYNKNYYSLQLRNWENLSNLSLNKAAFVFTFGLMGEGIVNVWVMSDVVECFLKCFFAFEKYIFRPLNLILIFYRIGIFYGCVNENKICDLQITFIELDFSKMKMLLCRRETF